MTTTLTQRSAGDGCRSPLDVLLVEPEAVYHAQRAHHLTSHALADFRACPQLYRQKQLGLIPEADSTAFTLGRAVHALTLEGRAAYEAAFAIGGPRNEKTGRPYGRETKAFAEWAAAAGRPALSYDQADLVEQVASAVRRHPVAAALLAEGRPEAVIRRTYGGLPCQARIDWISGRVIADLKTCDDLTWFEADARRFGYAHQLAFYRALVRGALGTVPAVDLIAVEKRAPFRCGVWRVSEQVLDHAERENLAAMQRLALCLETDTWPTGYEELRTFDHL